MSRQLTFNLTDEEYALYMQMSSKQENCFNEFEKANEYNVLIRKLSPISNQNEETRNAVLQFEGILKIYSLVSIVLLDVNVLCHDCILSGEKEWRNKYYCKQSYLLIYEFLETYNSNNTSINKTIKNDFLELGGRYKSLSKHIKNFKKKHDIDNYGRDIRRKIAAHIDSDFCSYYEFINSLRKENVISLLTDFLKVLDDIQLFFSDLLNSYSELLEQKILTLQNNISQFIKEHESTLSNEKLAELGSMIEQLNE